MRFHVVFALLKSKVFGECFLEWFLVLSSHALGVNYFPLLLEDFVLLC